MKIANYSRRGGASLFGAGKLLRLTALLAVTALFIGACGSDDDDGGSTGADPTATTAAATGSTGGSAETGSGAPTGSGDAGSTGSTGAGATGSAAGGSGLPGDLTDLTTLESFRWDMTFEGAGSLMAQGGLPIPAEEADSFSASGAYIAPDQAQVSAEIGGQTFEQVIKGDQQWLSVAGMVQGPLPTTAEASSLVFLTEAVDVQSFAGDLDCGDAEEVNGVSAIRCESNEANQELIDSFGVSGATVDEANVVVWIAEEGNFIVRWQLDATGTIDGEPFEWNLEANVTDINDVDSIEDPS